MDYNKSTKKRDNMNFFLFFILGFSGGWGMFFFSLLKKWVVLPPADKYDKCSPRFPESREKDGLYSQTQCRYNIFGIRIVSPAVRGSRTSAIRRMFPWSVERIKRPVF
jgi:hypothetical protein